MNRWPLAAISLAVACGCGAVPEYELDGDRRDAPLPYSVYVYIESAPADDDPQATTRDLPLNPTRLSDRILAAQDELNLVASLTVAPPEVATLESARVDALRVGADVFLRWESPQPAAYRFSHRSAWFLPNTALWFIAGFPSFWVRDRIYEIEWRGEWVLESLLSGREERAARELSAEVPLHLSERGFSAAALYTPPGFYEGPDVGRLLAPVAESWLTRELATALRDTLERAGGNAGIEVQLARNGDRFELAIASSSPLRRLRLDEAGRTLAEWDAINMPRPKTSGGDGSRRYSLRIDAQKLAAATAAGGRRATARVRWDTSRTFRLRLNGGRDLLLRVLAARTRGRAAAGGGRN